MKKRYIALVLLICLMLVTLTSCFAGEKEFSKAGMKITLTTRFAEKEIASQTAYFESVSAIVTALKEEFTLTDSNGKSLGSYTLDEYTQLVLKQNKLNSTINKDKEYYSFSYEKTVNGKDFYYFATTFRGNDAFWLIQFACTASNKDRQQTNFDKWASSVTFEQ